MTYFLAFYWIARMVSKEIIPNYLQQNFELRLLIVLLCKKFLSKLSKVKDTRW